MVWASWRVSIALAAAVGALITVPLVALPARAALRQDNFAPQVTAAGYAVVGVIVGVVIAIAALNARAIAANVMLSTAYLWALAAVAVVHGLNVGSSPGSVQLAIWTFSAGPMFSGFYVPGVLMILGAALLIGVLTAWPAGRRGDNRIGVALSGTAGPMLVAAAYLLAAPQFSGVGPVDGWQWSAYLFAPYAVIAGLAGSVLVAAIGPKGANLRRAPRPAAQPDPNVDQDDLTGSASSLNGLPKVAPTMQPAMSSDEPAVEEIDDAYALGRPLQSDQDVKAYATDTVEIEQATMKTAPTVSGRASVKAPLWPTSETPPEASPEARDSKT
jgi:hypothetical protein